MKQLPQYIITFGLVFLGTLGGVAQKNKTEIKIETDDLKTKRFELEELLAEGMKLYSMEEYSRADSALRKALVKDPNVAAVNYTLAQVLNKQNQYDEAAIYIQKAYNADPANKFYVLLLAETYTHQHKYDKAADLYKNLIEKDIDNADYGLELAAVYLLDEKYDNALKAYENLEKTVGIDEDITHQKQRIYVKTNKIDKAIAEADKLIKNDPTNPQYFLEKAKLLQMANRLDEADMVLKQALESNPDDSEIRVMLANSYRKKGDANGANQQMNQLFGNTNGDVDVKMQALLQMMREAKDSTARQAVLQRAQEIAQAHPKDFRVHTVHGDLLDKANRTIDARAAYLRAARLDQSVSQLWGAILELDSRLEQPDSLIKHSEQAIEVFPNDGVFWFWNGTAYFTKRSYDKAIESLEEAQKLTPSNKALSRIIGSQLGDAFQQTRQYARSEAAYEGVLKAFPDDDYVLNNYSYYLSLRKQKLETAKQMASQVVARHPTNATYLDTYAWVLYMLKDYKEAHAALEKAVTSNPKVSATVVEHYGDALYQIGNKDKAVEQWQKAKSMGSKSETLDKKIATKQVIE